MKGLRERILGSPEGLDGPSLARVLRRGDEALRVRAARALIHHPEAEATAQLVGLLQDPCPGVRRAAARGLGQRGVDEGLDQALARERSRTVLVGLAEALLRCGRPRPEVLAKLEARVFVSFETVRGPRIPERTVGLGIEDLEGELDEGLGQPADFESLRDERQSAGKRAENAWLVQTGMQGDPRFVEALVEAVERMDLDPARAFAHRRLAALSLGRIGVRTVAPKLARALEVEALEHEGRPGAGLGIQYPVRTVILWALGELQVEPEVLVGYLGNLHGSALGGFHLPAMGALWKLGDAAVPALRAVADRSDEAGQHARSVLDAL